MTASTSRMVGTVVVSDDQFADLVAAAAAPLEVAAVILGAVHRVPGGVRFLVSDIRWVPDNAYVERRNDGLTVSSDGYVAALGEAEERGLAALWFHTHPHVEGRPTPSKHDDAVDDQLSEVFKLRTSSGLYGTLIVSPRRTGVAFTGTLTEDTHNVSFTRMVVVGERLRILAAYNNNLGTRRGEAELFSRNVAAFGGAVQEALGSLRVAVVGAGGTGSAVAEQLVRLGVRHLLVADPDALEESNTTRVYGSTPGDVGRDKVEVLGAHLRRIAPAHITGMADSVNSEDVARAVAGCDVVFGCTDDNSGRMVLARLAAYARVIVIDCGIQLSTDADQNLSGIDGRVTTMRPGAACLICRDRIDLPRAAAEQMTHEEHQRLAGEGYAPALPGVQPAVVAFTTMVASQAVTELLDLLTGFGPTPRPTEVLLRVHDREVSTNTAAPRPGHFCDPEVRAVEQIAAEPFLGKVWVR
jgi:molybdopterin/thiamine biosynthesis adenylyltransferase